MTFIDKLIKILLSYSSETGIIVRGVLARPFLKETECLFDLERKDSLLNSIARNGDYYEKN